MTTHANRNIQKVSSNVHSEAEFWHFQRTRFEQRGETETSSGRAMKYKVDFCCLQETRIQEERDNKFRFIALETSKKHYGNGFFVSPKIANSVHSYLKVSDWISVLQDQLEDEYQMEKTGELTMKLQKREQYRCERVTDTKLRNRKIS